MSKLEEILENLYRDGQAHPDPRYAVGDYVNEAKQAILDWIEQDIIGEDEEVTVVQAKFEITPDTKYFTVPKPHGIEANILRDNMRKKLRP